MARGDGNGWVTCDAGHRHWGRHGAAGVLVTHPARGGVVLLALRAVWSHHGGTWGIPGGARDSHEEPVDAARREAAEETGLDTDALRVDASTVDDHGGWSYTTVHAVLDVAEPPVLAPADDESTELRWTPVAEVARLPLHPGFATFWSTHHAGADEVPEGAS